MRAATGSATVLTPPTLVALLHDGWRSDLPLHHPSAADAMLAGCAAR